MLAFLYCLRFFCLSYFHSRFLFSCLLFPLFPYFLSFLPLLVCLSKPLSLSPSTFCFSCFASLLSFCVRLQNCEKPLLTSSCLSVCLSVRPHGKTRLQLDGYLLNLTFEHFPKVCREESSLIEI
jgi:hypothetical protein